MSSRTSSKSLLEQGEEDEDREPEHDAGGSPDPRLLTILAKAFRGELVPTEAELARREGRDYEPASALLERIKSSTAAADGAESKRRKRRKKADS